MEYRLVTVAERPDLEPQTGAITTEAWPEFMLNDPVANRLWGRLVQDFPAFQILLLDDAEQVLGYGQSIPFIWDGTLEGLPTGWDAVLEQGMQDFDQGHAPTTLSALSITLAQGQLGKGLSNLLIRGMKAVAARHGLDAVLAPVRPSLKSRYPLTPFERYMAWTQADGSPFDPWVRTHWRLGATILRVAPESMVIPGTVAQWESWAGMRFPESGQYVVPGALELVSIDREQDLGCYIEPNVWMRHPVETADDGR